MGRTVILCSVEARTVSQVLGYGSQQNLGMVVDRWGQVGCSSVVEHLPKWRETVAPSLSTAKRNKSCVLIGVHEFDKLMFLPHVAVRFFEVIMLILSLTEIIYKLNHVWNCFVVDSPWRWLHNRTFCTSPQQQANNGRFNFIGKFWYSMNLKVVAFVLFSSLYFAGTLIVIECLQPMRAPWTSARHWLYSCMMQFFACVLCVSYNSLYIYLLLTLCVCPWWAHATISV